MTTSSSTNLSCESSPNLSSAVSPTESRLPVRPLRGLFVGEKTMAIYLLAAICFMVTEWPSERSVRAAVAASRLMPSGT